MVLLPMLRFYVEEGKERIPEASPLEFPIWWGDALSITCPRRWGVDPHATP